MSISGNLLDVSIAEVMQFIHIGGRTGTLAVRAGEHRAELGFHRGRIISASTSSSKRLGDLLLERGEIDEGTLARALSRQRQEQPRVSLGNKLVEMGAISAEALRAAVAEHFEQTVYELVTWTEGEFEFFLDELRPVDDIGVYPGDVLPNINLNTQMVILEALRIFDEKNRRRERADGSAPVPSGWTVEAEEAESAAPAPGEGIGLGVEEGAAPAQRPAERLQVVTDDDRFYRQLEGAIAAELASVQKVKPLDAGLTLPGESPPVVLADLRSGALGLEELAAIGRTRSRASLVAVVDEEIPPAAVYEAGALAALPPQPSAVEACLRSLVRAREAASAAARSGPSSGYARLKRVVADLRSGLLSATVALNLMQVISETVERAIMFLVRGGRLKAVGAFGFSPDGTPLADLTGRLEMALEDGGALIEAVNDGQARSVLFDRADLPEVFARLVGRPRTGQVVVFPVLGSQSVIAVVYTDNGPLSQEIVEIEILELAAAQVGVAFENEQLRRRAAHRD